MVNASLNWASIVGIVLAVCGGGLYFLRSFKPALARDYDVFFAAIGLLCGGILFFQGWRLDPILQFGQFLLAGTTVFFAYESVRLRGIATDQARRSSYFEDDDIPNMSRRASRSRWEDDYDQFEESPISSRRRFQSREIEEEDREDGFRQRRSSRTIPESAVSRRNAIPTNDKLQERDFPSRNRFSEDRDLEPRRSSFGERRNTRSQIKRGSRPLANQNTSRRTADELVNKSSTTERNQKLRDNLRKQTSINKVEEASFLDKNNELKRTRPERKATNDPKRNSRNQKGRYSVASKRNKPRDNSSRFDD